MLWANSTERGGAGPSAAVSTFRACRATATVPRACAGMHEATQRAEGRWAAPNGVEPPFRPLSAATGVRPPQDTPARAAKGATDAGKTPSARAGVLSREKKPRATRQVHCQRMSEADGRKTTLKSEFLNLQRNSATQVFDRMFLASGDFSLS